MFDRRSGSSVRNSQPVNAVPTGDAALQGDGVTADFLFRALRGNLPLFLVVAGATLAVTVLLVAGSTSQYTARAAIRMASERRTLTSGVEDAPQTLDRPVDPLLSAVQVLTSRTLVGAVVDTLGLRLQPIAPFHPGLPLFGRRLPPGTLRNVAVVPGSPVDTMLLRFTPTGVVAQSQGGSSEAAFGEILRLGAVQLTVPEPPPVGYTMAVVQPLDVTIDGAIRRLKVVPRPGTDVIDVRYTAGDPETAQRFVNHLARLFQSANGHSAQQQARRRREFLGEQLRVTDSLLLKAEATLSAFRSRQDMASSRDNLSAEQATASALQARKSDLMADRRVFAALLERVKNGSPASEAAFQALAYSPEVASDPVLGQLQQRLVSYRTRLDSLTTGPWRSIATNPDVVQLSTLVESTQAELLQAVKARLTSIDARIQILANERARGAQLMQSLPAQQAAEAGLDRRVEVLRNTTDALRQEYQKARISEALGAADIEILDPASLPYRPAGIPRAVQVALGLLIGLLLGGGAALLAEAANRSVRRPEELSTLGGAIELAVIPRITQLNGHSGSRLLLKGKVENGNGQASEVLFGATGALSAEAEAFRMLRISLAFSWGEKPCTLVVTSAAPQEGKTLIATNLAATFARGGARVLLVDCDIHRPRLHRVFHTTRAPGLMDLLRLTGVPSDVRTTVSHRLAAVRRTPIDRLSFLPCGADAQSTPELLEPATLGGLLHDLRTEFDVILLDTPPVLVSADAATLAASADGVIMVIRAGQTDRGAAEIARQRVAAAGGRVLGAVLNDPDGVTERFGKPYYAYDYPATVD
ncbi:MAG TPA: polysaccharide biosynthesis tyrosine autokinase [Gemmatimonadales bacterium]